MDTLERGLLDTMIAMQEAEDLKIKAKQIRRETVPMTPPDDGAFYGIKRKKGDWDDKDDDKDDYYRPTPKVCCRPLNCKTCAGTS